MQTSHVSPITRVLSGALVSGFFLLGLSGCPVKTGCTICSISGVMSGTAADTGGTAPAEPKAALNLQMSTSGPVSAVRVILTTADGTSETLSYSADQVSGINNNSVTTIPDGGLYDVEGKAPSKGTVEVDFSNGKSVSYPLTLEPESGKATATR